MADPSALVEATFDLIRAHPEVSGGTVDFFDGAAPDNQQPPWIQAFADPGFRMSTAWDVSSDLLDLTITTICVGSDARTSRRVVDWVTEALLNARPDVAGWAPHKIRQTSGTYTREDLDIADLWHTTPTWRVRAHAQETS